MKKIITLLLFLGSFIMQAQQRKHPQQKTKTVELQAFSKKIKQQALKDKIALEEHLKKNNLPRVTRTKTFTMIANRLNAFGQVEYLMTNNVNAAKTSGTDKLHAGGSLGLSLDGTGIEIAEWDGGAVRATHQEFNNTGSSRITIVDNVALNFHATHVAGTIIGGGVDANAKGMAPNATLKSYDFTDDFNEMVTEAQNGLKLSNHSYGSLAGWYWDGSAWQWANLFSQPLGHTEDFNFGYYDAVAKNYDDLSYLAPNYMIVKAAGNDNGNGPGASGGFPKDGPYDCLPTSSTAKNILVVGAVNDIVNGYTQPSDVVIASFSSTGPTDDGRIKPDIVANGTGLYSSYETSDNVYNSISGTSMATPTVTGSIALLNQHYKNLYGNANDMPSATIKALLINSADEAGNNPGPDYIFGWGLMNTATAAEKITESTTNIMAMSRVKLLNNQTYTVQAVATGTAPIKATVVWTDPAGTPINDFFTVLDNPTKMLVNDLDFTITENGNTHYPWQLDGTNPTNAATNNAKNNSDNVEGISVGTLPAGTVVTLTVNHAGILTNNEQWFSLVTSGLTINNNDNFANAYEIIPTEYSSNLAAYTTTIGTADGANTTCASAAPKNNVWFKFTALTANQSVFVLSDGSFGTLKNPVLSLWNSTGTTQIACHQGTTTNKAYFNVDNLTVGETYYIAVDNANSADAGTFSLFADASAIQSESSTSGTLEAGTIRYNNLLHKFQGWNGTEWKNFN